MDIAGPSKTTLNPYQPFLNGKNTRLKFTSKSPFTPQFVETQLQKSSNLDPKALYENRVKGKHLILETSTRSRKENEERQLQRAKERERKKLGGMGRKEAAFTGMWKLEKEQTKYRLFIPLHQLWLGYMSELLGLWKAPEQQTASMPTMPNSAGMHAKLVKADFHGSIISVKQSKNPCLVGVKGIVILETENAFRIITKNDQVKLIPKRNSIFTFSIPLYDIRSNLPKTDEISDVDPLDTIPKMEFELYGNQFCFRSADRASKKFKAKETIEL
ncbi:RNase P subunit p29-like protein [Schizopora paradoxa]|uniref:Ribonuclease P protein subunit n=1 Tax=Schizopora paradoxa TaxID=27342 RepID=A0A0H2S045_9AGAM|nr:RNase P subunit p29-like protein [Schizopora paradoxa]